MAGDWLKVEANTPEKGEVLAITARMGWEDPDVTVGKLFRLWRWFDQHTENGNAHGVTSALLDRVVGVTGFCECVREVGWLIVSSDGVALPNFDRHNGKTAKTRALTAKRVGSHRKQGSEPLPDDEKSNAPNVTSALAREEKKRDISQPSVAQGKPAKPRGSKVCPETFVVDADMVAWAKAEGITVSIPEQTKLFRDHEFAKPITKWEAAWRNWMRKAQGFAGERSARGGNGYETPKMKAERQRAAELSGGYAQRAAPPGEAQENRTSTGEIIDMQAEYIRIGKAQANGNR